ncbi:hypothetical protein [Isoptericola sp. NPDC019482]|uniref:hypothetical protein n=1 Tax=Isoptericola sp. NPDC019482 TaxID=3154688 RepID=UPI003475D743
MHRFGGQVLDDDRRRPADANTVVAFPESVYDVVGVDLGVDLDGPTEALSAVPVLAALVALNGGHAR